MGFWLIFGGESSTVLRSRQTVLVNDGIQLFRLFVQLIQFFLQQVIFVQSPLKGGEGLSQAA
jgi:hypothetical protein